MGNYFDPKWECASREDLRARQSELLVQTVERVYQNVPYYRKKMDEAGVKGYAHPDNFKRLRRCELLAAEKGLTVPEIAMAWLFNQRALDVYALSSPSKRERMRSNVAAGGIHLTDAECRWLDLETDHR